MEANLTKGEEASAELIVARGNAPILLQFVEEALDAIALAIKRLGPAVLGFAIGSVRDVGDRALTDAASTSPHTKRFCHRTL